MCSGSWGLTVQLSLLVCDVPTILPINPFVVLVVVQVSLRPFLLLPRQEEKPYLIGPFLMINPKTIQTKQAVFFSSIFHCSVSSWYQWCLRQSVSCKTCFLNNASYCIQFASGKRVLWEKAQEQDDLSEIKLDFVFFLCLLSPRGNRTALVFLRKWISSKGRGRKMECGNKHI